MREEFLNLIPDELLNLIWVNINPTYIYNLNKAYYEQFYKFRFLHINNNRIYKKIITPYYIYNVNNYNYMKYIIKHDLSLFFKNIISNVISYNKYYLAYTIKFEDKQFKNLYVFCFYYINLYNSYKSKEFINSILKNLKLTDFIKKEHKYLVKNNNNSKNIRWKA